MIQLGRKEKDRYYYSSLRLGGVAGRPEIRGEAREIAEMETTDIKISTHAVERPAERNDCRWDRGV
jgi:hypothetical protein